MQSLVHEGTFRIGGNELGAYTIDKVKIEGEYYSSKPPLLSVCGALIYGGLHLLLGLDIRSQFALTVVSLTLLLSVLPYAVFLVYAYRIARLEQLSADAQLRFLLVLCFGTTISGFATVISNYPSTLALLATGYYLWRVRDSQPTHSRANYFLLGLLISSAAAIDFGAFLYVPVLLLACASSRCIRAVVWVGVGLVLPLGLTALYFKLVGGDLTPFYLRKELYAYENSVWYSPELLSSLEKSKLTYLWHNLLGHHGFFAITPVFLLSLREMVRDIKLGIRRTEAICFFFVIVICVAVYTILKSDYGGLAVGNRWLFVLHPIALLYLARWIKRTEHNAQARRLFSALFLWGVVFWAESLEYPAKESVLVAAWRWIGF